MKFKTPTLLTITAPTCAGKSVLLNHLIAVHDCARVVSTTTRPRRAGEVDGVDYFFITEEESRRLEETNSFVELVKFGSARYGVTCNELTRVLQTGRTPCLIIEPQGVTKYKEYCNSIGISLFSVFVMMPEQSRIDRLIARTVKDLHSVEKGDRNTTLQVVRSHCNRLASVLGDERHWQSLWSWDVLVEGDDVKRAGSDIEAAIKWKETRTQIFPSARGFEL